MRSASAMTSSVVPCVREPRRRRRRRASRSFSRVASRAPDRGRRRRLERRAAAPARSARPLVRRSPRARPSASARSSRRSGSDHAGGARGGRATRAARARTNELAGSCLRLRRSRRRRVEELLVGELAEAAALVLVVEVVGIDAGQVAGRRGRCRGSCATLRPQPNSRSRVYFAHVRAAGAPLDRRGRRADRRVGLGAALLRGRGNGDADPSPGGQRRFPATRCGGSRSSGSRNGSASPSTRSAARSRRSRSSARRPRPTGPGCRAPGSRARRADPAARERARRPLVVHRLRVPVVAGVPALQPRRSCPRARPGPALPPRRLVARRRARARASRDDREAHGRRSSSASRTAFSHTVPAKKSGFIPAWSRAGFRNVSSRNSRSPITPSSTSS